MTDEELNRAVAEKVMGWKVVTVERNGWIAKHREFASPERVEELGERITKDAKNVPLWNEDIPGYATAAEDMMTILAKMDRFDLNIKRRDGQWWVEFCEPSSEYPAHDASLCRAVALAAVAARGG